MGDEAGAAAVRDRFEARRREFREEQIQRSFYELSEGADTIPVNEFGKLCFKVDTKMPPEEVERAVREIDRDGDGSIDLGEFRVWYMKKLDRDDKEALKKREAGFGDQDEWDELDMQRRLVRQMEKLEAARIRRTFETIDEDKSGEIERGEFHTLLRRLAPTMEPEERDAAFDEIDGDGSGALDYDEFVAWYNSPEIKQMRGDDKREAEARAKLERLEAEVAQKKVERAARRAEYEEQSGAAGKLQAVLRGRLGRRRAHQARIDEQNNLKRAATKLQCAVRGRIARRQRTFAAVALAAQAELRAKEDVSKLYWGDSEEEAEREAKLKKDFLRLQATASGAVQQYSWEEWRWRWLEMRSGGWLERMEPSLQAEHCRRMAEEAQVTEEEIAAMVVPKLDSPPPPSSRLPPLSSPSKRTKEPARAETPDRNARGVPDSRSPIAARPGVRLRGLTKVDTNRPESPAEDESSFPDLFASARTSPRLEEEAKAAAASLAEASRLRRQAEDLLQGVAPRDLPERAQSALSLLQSGDGEVSTAGARLSSPPRTATPLGGRRNRTVRPSSVGDQSRPRPQSLPPAARRKHEGDDDGSSVDGASEYGRKFGIAGWDSEEEEARPATADGYFQKPMNVGNSNPPWATAADFIMGQVDTRSQTSQSAAMPEVSSPNTSGAAADKSGEEGARSGGGFSYGNVSTNRAAEASAAKELRRARSPKKRGANVPASEPVKGTPLLARKPRGNVTQRQQRRRRRPVRGLAGWKQGESRGSTVTVGAGRTAVYSTM